MKNDIRTLSYRESFSWENFMSYFTEFHSDWIWRKLKEEYPVLREEDRMELRGLLSGTIAIATDLQTVGEKCDGAEDAMEQTVVDYVYEIVKRRSESAARADISSFFDAELDIANDAFEQELQRIMPGAYLAAKTEIALVLTFPGRLLETNAKTAEGHVASWTIQPLDAISRPVILYLASEVRK